MSPIGLQFGYSPIKWDFDSGAISVRTLSGHESIVSEINSSGQLHKDWFYAPLQESKRFPSGGVSTLPYSSRVFGLPKTHSITHETDSSHRHLEYLVWSLSFFSGVRLTTTEAGFLDATPVKIGKLTDIVIGNKLGDAMIASDRFWAQHHNSPRAIDRMASCIHSLFLSQTPNLLEYERFLYLYTALDTCFKQIQFVTNDKASCSHAKRIEWMCNKYGIPVPSWATPNGNATEVSAARNDGVHEGLFYEHPLGFALYGGDHRGKTAVSTLLQMRALVCRLIVAITIGSANEYVKSRVDSRQMQRLDL